MIRNHKGVKGGLRFLVPTPAVLNTCTTSGTITAMDYTEPPMNRRQSCVTTDHMVHWPFAATVAKLHPMKRLCFDTESTYWKSPGSGVGTPDEHRKYFQRLNIRFKLHCAVVYDASTGRYVDFVRNEVGALVKLLLSADELISHSGKWVDQLVLEHECGIERVEPLTRIPHHDLFDLLPLQSLDALTKSFVPDQDTKMRRDFERRMRAAKEHEPKVDGFIFQKLAKARYDVERTWAIFEALQRAPQNSAA